MRSIVHDECEQYGQILRSFNDNNQHDAAEFFASILEHLFRNHDSLTIKESLFGGLSQKTMFCQTENCNQSETLQIETISEIVPIEFVGYSLEICLEQFFSPEEIERRCSHCGGDRSTQVTTFVREPVNLLLQLNRFRYSPFHGQVVKLNEEIIFPTVIQLPSGSSYRLQATINHHGETANSGHYTCLIFDSDANKVTLVDDTRIFPSAEISEEISQQVYILAYTKI